MTHSACEDIRLWCKTLKDVYLGSSYHILWCPWIRACQCDRIVKSRLLSLLSKSMVILDGSRCQSCIEVTVTVTALLTPTKPLGWPLVGDGENEKTEGWSEVERQRERGRNEWMDRHNPPLRPMGRTCQAKSLLWETHRDIERKRAKERKTDTVRKEQNLGRQRERERRHN